MAFTPSIQDSAARVFTLFSSVTAAENVSAARVFAVYKFPSVGEQVSSARAFAVYNFPSVGEQVSAARALIPLKRQSTIGVSQSRVFAVVAGRIANVKLRVWTFTLDGHDFLVVRLGDDSTLLYDLYSQQWIEWTSKLSGAWRPNTGMTWVGGAAQADAFGSSVIAGDDTFGLLWLLDPDQGWDDHPDYARVPQQIDFDRIVTGQVLASGRQYNPCYVIFVDGDNYGLIANDFVPTVLLEYSDDQGRNFITSETLNVTLDLGVNNPYAWYSLGQIASPGRIFRITDNGLFSRIDSMSMNDDAG